MQLREPQQERGFARRAAIIVGAAETFDRYGYGQTSLKQISAQSGATVGSVYFYFPSKEALALSVIEEQNRRTFDAMSSIASNHVGIATLVQTSKSVADLLLTDVVVRAGIRLSLEQGTLSTPTAQFYQDWMTSLEPTLREADEAGELDTPLDVAEIAHTLVPYFTGTHLVSNVMAARANLYPELTVMWEIVIAGIVAEAHQARLRGLIAKVLAGPQPGPGSRPVHSDATV